MSWKSLLFRPDLTLQNKRLKLLTMKESLIPGIMKYGTDPKIWQFASLTKNTNPESFTLYWQKAMANMANQIQHPFVYQDQKTKELIGGSRFYNIDEGNQNLCIGYSFVVVKHQRDGTNRNGKFLMLRYAFEQLGVERLSFHIDTANIQSRKNVESLKAQFEGIERSERWVPDLSYPNEQRMRRRDTCVYSIIKSEWPDIKATVFKGYENDDC